MNQLVVLELELVRESQESQERTWYLCIFNSLPAVLTDHSFESLSGVRGLVLLDVLRGVENLPAVGTRVLKRSVKVQSRSLPSYLLPHLMDHVLVSPDKATIVPLHHNGQMGC